jgi:5,10-methylenetetrahydromethanopterin reductase
MNYGLLLLGEHTPDRLIGLAQLIEKHGFENLWYAEEKFFRDPYVSLTHVLHHTSRIKVGVGVTDPYTRHPALTAMAMGTLAELAGERGVLGIGAGFSGLQALGMKQPKPVTALREAISLMRRLWAGETVTTEGEIISFYGGELNYKSPPNIPIHIATSGRQILRLAGEIADGVWFGDLASPRVIEPALAEVRRGAARAGRSLDGFPLISRANLILSDDAAAAREPMRGWIATSLWYAYPNWDARFNYSPDMEERLKTFKDFVVEFGRKPRNVDDFKLVAQFQHLITDDLVQDAALAGTVDDVVKQIVAAAAWASRNLPFIRCHSKARRWNRCSSGSRSR